MKNVRQTPGTKRMDRLIHERIHDPYQARAKLTDPTACPQCNAVYHNGRWTWAERPAEAHEALCQACHRINDKYPAGELTLRGGYFEQHKTEILHLARNEEKLETGEHPLNRIMAIEDRGDEVLITTTDIHLARRIGEALHRAHKGQLDHHYDEEAHFIRVGWSRKPK